MQKQLHIYDKYQIYPGDFHWLGNEMHIEYMLQITNCSFMPPFRKEKYDHEIEHGDVDALKNVKSSLLLRLYVFF